MKTPTNPKMTPTATANRRRATAATPPPNPPRTTPAGAPPPTAPASRRAGRATCPPQLLPQAIPPSAPHPFILRPAQEERRGRVGIYGQPTIPIPSFRRRPESRTPAHCRPAPHPPAPPTVIPTPPRHSRESGNPHLTPYARRHNPARPPTVIPAEAGIQNPGALPPAPSSARPPPSFRRRPESRTPAHCRPLPHLPTPHRHSRESGNPYPALAASWIWIDQVGGWCMPGWGRADIIR